MKAQSGVKVYLYFFFDLGAWCVWVISVTLKELYPGKEPQYLLCRMLGGPCLDGCEKSVSHRGSAHEPSSP